MNKLILWSLGCVSALVCRAEPMPPLRPPAVPLVVSNPYLSIWSAADKLTDNDTQHWTGKENCLGGLVRIDGTPYRIMGKSPAAVPALPQVGLNVTPTRTIYDFENAQIHLRLTFTTPALPDDIDVLARPVTYLTWEAKSLDAKPHTVSLFQSASGELTVNSTDSAVTWARETMGDLTAMRIGSEDQTLLQPAGDDTRINWGYAYLAAPTAQSKTAAGAADVLMQQFAASGTLPEKDDEKMPRPARDRQPAIAIMMDLGNVADQPVSRHAMIGYDEIWSVRFLGQKLRPYWRRNGATPSDLFQATERDYAKLSARCEKFDAELAADMAKQGGDAYAKIGALAYRQALAGCGLAADANKQPLYFTKENSSNGCIATVDVIYPAAPQFLLMGPTYAKALVAPAMIYSTSKQWKFPFAPHDLGTYPQANAQVYGGGESSTNEGEMMPVEESGNLIILCAAIARMEGNTSFADKYWKQLTQWEAYLEKYGLDPEDQLCTDDFMGHLAHNSNLSIKAILAIAAYGDLCKMRGDTASADKYLALARDDAKHWMTTAADGDHYRIAFDKPNSWSQKYNLVWDKLLGYGVFPPEVAKKEVAHYKKIMLKFGVPLDSRTRLTKTDWSVWSATLADNQADFEAIVTPITGYLNTTTARLPFVDSYITDNKASDGMKARPVIGGVFVKMLDDQATWKKWAAKDTFKSADYAGVPEPMKITEFVPTSQKAPATWKYTTKKPGAEWTTPGFDDATWKSGPAGFGSPGTPNGVFGTDWRSADIWIRREVTLPADVDAANAQLMVYHDEDVEVYLDGVLAMKAGGWDNSYSAYEMRPAAKGV